MNIVFRRTRTVRTVAAALGAITITSLLLATAFAAASASSLLPSGYLSTRGNQIVDSAGRPVRIACVGWFGTAGVGGRLETSTGPYKTIDQNVAAMAKFGFNCIRIDWNNKSLEDNDTVQLGQFTDVVTACKKYGMKVIFDNHTNEARGPNWQNVAQQMNGLWFDKGPGTDGTDGGGDVGTITNEQFTKDWVTFAKMWAGNPTVIGFDIRNEPCAHTKTPALWGGGGPTDIHAMYERVGNAVLAVDPGALIICESVINYNIDSYEGDFQHPNWLPIKLSSPTKLVYSVHEYPKEVGGYKGPEYGPGYIARMNRTWGWLIKDNIAPVWIGEMGTTAGDSDEYAWAMTVLDYINGKVSSGIQFKKGQQPISGDWWCWGYLPGEHPDGCLTEDGQLKPVLTRFIDLLLFLPEGANMSASSVAIEANSGAQLLPAGYLSTNGSQIVDSHGNPVRIACCDDFGAGTDDGYISYDYADFGPYRTLDANLGAIKKCGFNCLRVDFNDSIVNDAPMMVDYDTLVAGCKKYGIKVILCHHNDEATPHDWGNCAQQSNGLWIDSGPGTDGSDDSKGHPAGTVTAEKFTQDWVKIAKRYAGNDTVIGFDLDNEPHNQFGHNGENWGKGGPDDIWAMFTNTGDAIQAVDPGALIICEGPALVTDKASLLYWVMDLAEVRTKPVVLNIPDKVVYSSHEYPSEVCGSDPSHDHGDYYIKVLNADWGYLIKENIAPVWIGESGASMMSQNSIAWGKTLLDYMNGLAPDGPRFTMDQQPVSGNWFWWRCVPDENPDGCLSADGQLNPLQKPFIEQLFFFPNGHIFSLLGSN